MFLVSIRDGDSDLLLGACRTERDASGFLAKHAIDVYLRTHGCKCCGQFHVKDEAERARIEREVVALGQQLLVNLRIERVG